MARLAQTRRMVDGRAVIVGIMVGSGIFRTRGGRRKPAAQGRPSHERDRSVPIPFRASARTLFAVELCEFLETRVIAQRSPFRIDAQKTRGKIAGNREQVLNAVDGGVFLPDASLDGRPPHFH